MNTSTSILTPDTSKPNSPNASILEPSMGCASPTRFESQPEQQADVEWQQKAKPFCFSNIIVNKPWIIILLVSGLSFLCLTLIMTLGLLQNATSNDRQFLLWTHDLTVKMDMRRVAHREMRSSLFPQESVPYSTLYKPWTAIIIYQAEEGLLKPPILQQIIKFEEELARLTDFQLFCVKKATDFSDVCDESTFTPTILSTYFKGRDYSSQSSIDAIMADYSTSQIRAFFGDELTPSHLSTNYGRSYFPFAGPVEGYSSVYDNQAAQEAEFVKLLRSMDSKAQNASDQHLKIYIACYPLITDEMIAASESDQLLIPFSFLAVFLYVTVHLRSVTIALTGMIQTALAFPIAFFIYRVLFQITFFNTIHSLAVFIIIGIAADDFFVFNDAWKQSAKIPDIRDN